MFVLLILYTVSHWDKRQATASHKSTLWRVARRMLTESFTLTPKNSTTEEALQMDHDTMPKFLAMEHIFWVRVSSSVLFNRLVRLQHYSYPTLKKLSPDTLTSKCTNPSKHRRSSFSGSTPPA